MNSNDADCPSLREGEGGLILRILALVKRGGIMMFWYNSWVWLETFRLRSLSTIWLGMLTLPLHIVSCTWRDVPLSRDWRRSGNLITFQWSWFYDHGFGVWRWFTSQSMSLKLSWIRTELNVSLVMWQLSGTVWLCLRWQVLYDVFVCVFLRYNTVLWYTR